MGRIIPTEALLRCLSEDTRARIKDGSLSRDRLQVRMNWNSGEAKRVHRHIYQDGALPDGAPAKDIPKADMTGAAEPPVADERFTTEVLSIGDAASYEKKLRKLSGQLRAQRRLNKHLLEENEELEARIDTVIGLQDMPAVSSLQPLSKRRGHKEAVALIGMSDWHVEERVEAHTINGLNEYNPEIAEARIREAFRRGLKLVEKERAAIKVDQLLLWLGGDLISGYIHDELIEGNFLSPLEALLFVKRLCIEGLDLYLRHGKFKKVVVICNYGNHGRTTKKIRISTGYKNSYEWYLYHDLKQHYKDHKQVEWLIPSGDVGYVDVLGQRIRFLHGDSIRYYGGVGGISIPLGKALKGYAQQRHADMTILGHFHQYCAPFPECAVNGSVIGFNAYAQRIKARPEPPRQMFRLIDSERGFTISAPIFCEAERQKVYSLAG